MFGAGEQTGAAGSCTRADEYVDGLVRVAIPPGRHPHVPVFVVPPPVRAVFAARPQAERGPAAVSLMPPAGRRCIIGEFGTR
jgi:hypothetical protein